MGANGSGIQNLMGLCPGSAGVLAGRQVRTLGISELIKELQRLVWFLANISGSREYVPARTPALPGAVLFAF